MRIFLTIIFILVCIALTVLVLVQQGKDAGLGAIGGIGDTYWGKNKSRSMEGKLVNLSTNQVLVEILNADYYCVQKIGDVFLFQKSAV